MRILIASNSDAAAEYLVTAGHEARTIYANNLIAQAAQEFGCEMVIYFLNVRASVPHIKVLKSLSETGAKVILIADSNNPLIPYAKNLGITDILILPVSPDDILYRLTSLNFAIEKEDKIGVNEIEEEQAPAPALHEYLKSAKKPQEPEEGCSGNTREPAEREDRELNNDGEITDADKGTEDKQTEPKKEEVFKPNLNTVPHVKTNPSEENHSQNIYFLTNDDLTKIGDLNKLPEKINQFTPDAVLIEKIVELEIIKQLRSCTTIKAVPIFFIGPEVPEELTEHVDGSITSLDKTELHKIQRNIGRIKELWNAANHDELTGAYNRKYLNGWMKAQKQPYTVLMCDLDYFKRINDTYKHDAGDEVLRQFVKYLDESVRDKDIVVRYGGEEFIIILANTAILQAEPIVSRLYGFWPGKVAYNNVEIAVTFSAGLACSTNEKDVIGKADKLLYTAKDMGRDRIMSETGLIIARQQKDERTEPKQNESEEPEAKPMEKFAPFSRERRHTKTKSTEFEKKIRAPAEIEYAIDEIKRHRVIVVWNLDGWGKAESAIEITVKLQKHKRRVLLMEMDFLNPAIDRIAGIPIVKKQNIPGKSVTEIGTGLLTLGSQLEPEHAVGLIRPKHGNLKVDYLAAGNDLGVTGEYASEQVYHDIVALLAKQYDHVVIDLGVNTDNQVFRGVVKRADILVIPASNNAVAYTRYEKIVAVKEAIFVKRG